MYCLWPACICSLAHGPSNITGCTLQAPSISGLAQVISDATGAKNRQHSWAQALNHRIVGTELLRRGPRSSQTLLQRALSQKKSRVQMRPGNIQAMPEYTQQQYPREHGETESTAQEKGGGGMKTADSQATVMGPANLSCPFNHTVIKISILSLLADITPNSSHWQL